MFYLEPNIRKSMSESSEKSSHLKDIEQLDAAMGMLKTAELKIGSIFKDLTIIIKKTKDDIEQLEKDKEQLELEKQELVKKADLQAEQISGLTQEQMSLLEEYEKVKSELEKFTKIATSIGKINLEDMRATLSLYSVLFEQVFDSQPHFKILYMLHGEKEVMTLDQIKSAMGIGGALVLRACHELANANLINFDDSTRNISLKQRLYEQASKE